jgi:hypothetical protein
MSTNPKPKAELYPMFTKQRNEIVVACDANPAKFGRISLLVKPIKDSIKVDGITVLVPSPSSSCTLDSTEPKARKKSGVDSPRGRSWRSGEVVDTIGGPTIPMSKRMTFMPEDNFPEDIDEVNKIDGPYTSKSLETQKVLKGREDNTAVVPTLVPTHSFLHGMSNIISTPTTVGSSTARLVTVVKDQKKKSRGGYKCKCGCGGCVQGLDSYTLLCAQRLGVPHDPHGIS